MDNWLIGIYRIHYCVERGDFCDELVVTFESYYFSFRQSEKNSLRGNSRSSRARTLMPLFNLAIVLDGLGVDIQLL